MLFAELELCEAAKKTIDLTGGQAKMEVLANSSYDAANMTDRTGSAGTAAALQHIVAALYLECLAQFNGGQVPPDAAEKLQYSRARAVHLQDCVKRGTAPQPPAPPGQATAPATTPAPAAPAPAAARENPIKRKALGHKQADLAAKCIAMNDIPGACKAIRTALEYIDDI